MFNRFELIPRLVAHGANPNHVDRRGKTLLQLAQSHDNTEAVDALRHAGAGHYKSRIPAYFR
ncbi:ankyrin repeat domain-containing protein [Burkholderia aenigmatica]|uniref:ankyrin repeat domain-containing protein n=1 Tax=Burkholderia cepacia complex TaxID=87882 RepID=UPI00391F5328